MKTVAIIGHKHFYSDADEIMNKIIAAAEKLIKEGATEFLLNSYSTFDFICSLSVHDFKAKYPDVKSILVPIGSKKAFSSVYDGVMEFPYDKSDLPVHNIINRNKFVADKADVLIAYVCNSCSGTGKIVEYAKSKGKKVIEII